MMPLIVIGGLAFLFGMALGGWLLVWIGRRADSRNNAVIEQMIKKAEREGFDRGYASALGVRVSINQPADYKKRRAC